MSNPAGMEAIRDYKSGKTNFMPFDALSDTLQSLKATINPNRFFIFSPPRPPKNPIDT
jgi:hypothetical protein